MIQLELFPAQEKTLQEMIEEHRASVKRDMDKLRKALFREQAEMKKMYQEVAHNQAVLNMNIFNSMIFTL